MGVCHEIKERLLLWVGGGKLISIEVALGRGVDREIKEIGWLACVWGTERRSLKED